MGLAIAQVFNGAGMHTADLDPEMNKFGLKLNFASQPFYLWAIPLVKTSVGLFLLRITPNDFYRRLVQGSIIFLLLYTLVCFLTVMLQCQNLAVLWDFTVETTCWDPSVTLGLSYANSSESCPCRASVLPPLCVTLKLPRLTNP